jgi:hypothetical protein
MTRLKKFFLGLPVLIMAAILMFVVACGDDQPTAQSAPVPVDDGTGKASCMEKVPPEMGAQLTSYIHDNGDTVNQVISNSDGTQDICILEQQPKGGFEQHYYRKDDGGLSTQDWMTYMFLTGNARGATTLGLVSGELDFGEYMALRLLTDIDDRGDVRHPYDTPDRSRFDPRASWNRKQVIVQNVHITQIQYGKNKPEDFAVAHTKKPPVGYEKTPTIAKPTGSNTQIRRGGFGPDAVQPKATSMSPKTPTMSPRVYTPPKATPRPTPRPMPTQPKTTPTTRKTTR